MVVFTIDELMNSFDDYKVVVAQTDDGENRYSTGALEHVLSIGEPVAVVVERPEIRKEDQWWLMMVTASDDLLVTGETPQKAWERLFSMIGEEWPKDPRGTPVHYNEARLRLVDRGHLLGCMAKQLDRTPTWEGMVN